MQGLVAIVGTATFWISAPFVLAFVRIVWTVFVFLTERALFLLSLRTREIELVLDAREGIPENITSLNLLFVRYGNDTHLGQLASDQERFHGRLRNKVIRIVSTPPKAGEAIRIKMRVHKRLGTQFKPFVEVTGDPGAAVEYLGSHKSISGVDASELPRLRSGDVTRYRIFFPIDRLPKVKTVDNFTNNFIPSV